MVLQANRTATRNLNRSQLDAAFVDAHRRTWAILADLTPAQMQVPCNPGINPPLWEYAHIAWFTEHWILRDPQRDAQGRFAPTRPSLLADADRWFDSGRVAHDDRWHLDLPSLPQIIDYVGAVLEHVRAKLATAGVSEQLGTKTRDLAMFNLAIDSKLRACDLTKLRVRDVCLGSRVVPRATVMQQKTQRPVRILPGNRKSEGVSPAVLIQVSTLSRVCSVISN